MKEVTRNIKGYSEYLANTTGFNIILDMSRKREFLMYHKHNVLLYKLLENGVRLEALRRWKSTKQASRREQKAQTKVFNMKSHLLKVIDCFLAEEYEYRKQKQRTILNSETDLVTYIQPEGLNGLKAV